MTKLANTVKNTGRAALVAVLLGASMIPMAAVTPAAAQPNVGFSINIGGDYSTRSGKRYYKKCLNDRQVVRALRDYGWRDVEVIRQLKGQRVELSARWKRDWFEVRVDKCTGEVYSVRPSDDYEDDYTPPRNDYRPGRPGIGLEFNFGN